MDNNKELFELITKMYSEFTAKMDSMHSEMQDMKAEQKKTNERLGSLESKVDTGFEKLTARIDDISSGIGSVVGNDVSETLSDKIDSINDDLSFIKHKLNITEEDVYKIKNHLRIVK